MAASAGLGRLTRALAYALICALPAATALPAQAALQSQLETLALDGRPQPLLIAHDDAAPVTRVLLFFAGGDGRVELSAPLSAAAPDSLRGLWVRPGTALVVVDAPGGLSLAERESPAYRAHLQALVTALAPRFPDARFVALGVSNGAVSAAVAGSLPEVEAVVMLGGVFRRYSDLAAFGVRGRLLVIHHEADRCVPPEFDESFRLWVKPVLVRRGAQAYPEAACGAGSAHVFAGQRERVAAAVHEWLASGRAPTRLP
jgi:dienelactone hydrolase